MTKYSLLMIAAAFLLSTQFSVFAASENAEVILIKSEKKKEKEARKDAAETQVEDEASAQGY